MNFSGFVSFWCDTGSEALQSNMIMIVYICSVQCSECLRSKMRCLTRPKKAVLGDRCTL